MLATHGIRVLGVDTNRAVIDALLDGRTSFVEPEVTALAEAAVSSGMLQLSTTLEACDTYLIAVPTPVTRDESSDLTHVRSALRAIVPHLAPGALVILESTVPPGTTMNLVIPEVETSGLKVGTDVMVAHCPERVLPGSTIKELVNNDRIVGGFDTTSASRAGELYAAFVRGNIHYTDVTTAEMVKVMENTFRDVNIALANEFAKLADVVGINVWDAIALANNHPRVNILRPGPGVGGHCVAVDPWFLVSIDDAASRLIRTARNVNDGMPAYVVDTLRRSADLTEGHVAILGLAYRAGLGDTRESPALAIIDHLRDAGIRFKAHDPYVIQKGMPVVNESLEVALSGANAIVIATDHREFSQLDPLLAGNLVAKRFVYDTRRCLATEDWRRAGFTVLTLGTGR
jgi:UDP-N-acetyl-D-mannosaminuronic acid dehydrogenase